MATATHLPYVGIDCNGLVYYVINEATGGVVMKTFGNVPYSSGVHIDYYLCSTSYGTQKTKAKDIVPGCFLHLDGHIMIVYDVIKNASGVVTQIKYAHSQLNGLNPDEIADCATSGPYKGYITINDENKDLNAKNSKGEYIQKWVDLPGLGNILCGLYYKTMLLNCVAPFTS